MRTCILLIVAMAGVSSLAMAMVLSDGGYVQIPDIRDPRVQALGRWAVSEYNSKEHARITFNNLVRGKHKGLSWFYLVINGSISDAVYRNYEASVYQLDKKSKPKLFYFIGAPRNITQ